MPRIPSPFYTSSPFPVHGVAEDLQKKAAAKVVPWLADVHRSSAIPRSLSTMEQQMRLHMQRRTAENSYRAAFSAQPGIPPEYDSVMKRLLDAGLGTLRLAIQLALDLEQRLMEAAPDAVNPAYIPQERPAPARSARHARPHAAQRGKRRREIPMIMQVRPNACGDACMQMVLAYFRKSHMPVGTNDRLFFRGLQPRDIEKALSKKELVATRLMPSERKNWKLDEIKKHTRTFGPLIAVGQFHFVVIAGVKGESVLINDPLLGQRKMSIAQLNKWMFHDKRLPVLGFSQARPAAFGDAREEAVLPVPGPGSPAAPGRVDQAMVSALKAIYKRL